MSAQQSSQKLYRRNESNKYHMNLCFACHKILTGTCLLLYEITLQTCDIVECTHLFSF